MQFVLTYRSRKTFMNIYQPKICFGYCLLKDHKFDNALLSVGGRLLLYTCLISSYMGNSPVDDSCPYSCLKLVLSMYRTRRGNKEDCTEGMFSSDISPVCKSSFTRNKGRIYGRFFESLPTFFTSFIYYFSHNLSRKGGNFYDFLNVPKLIPKETLTKLEIIKYLIAILD